MAPCQSPLALAKNAAGRQIHNKDRYPSCVQVFHSDRYTFPLPVEHRFPLTKYGLLRERVEQLPRSAGAILVPAPRVLLEDLLLVHEAGYVDDFCHGRMTREAMQRIGFPWSPCLVERTLRSCGATVAASHAALSDGASLYLAGGTHHARRDQGAGYCVFNDCAVSARVLQQHGIERVLIIDTDVHQGDGTAAIFAHDDSVFTFSIHGDRNFPATKAHSDLDIALPTGTRDVDYLAALTTGLDLAFARSEPQFVLFLSGADPHEGDRLGTLALTKDGILRRDQLVYAAIRARKLPCVTVMGGGYGKRLDDTVDIYFATVQAALAAAKD